MTKLYNRFRLSYLAQVVTCVLSVPFCVYVWPSWSWTTSLIVNGIFLPVSLGLCYFDRKTIR